MSEHVWYEVRAELLPLLAGAFATSGYREIAVTNPPASILAAGPSTITLWYDEGGSYGNVQLLGDDVTEAMSLVEAVLKELQP